MIELVKSVKEKLYKMKKMIFSPILIITLIILILLFYPYSLRSDYKNALHYCTQQTPSTRGEFVGCMEVYFLQYNRKNYEKYIKIKTFCNFLYNNEYDKEQCVDRIMFL